MKNNKIHTLSGGDSNPQPQPLPEAPPLTMQLIQNIGAAYARLIELKGQAILTPTIEAEVKGLIEYLSSEFLAHGSEFLACAVAIKSEYEPILNLLASVSNRVTAIGAARNSRAKQQSAVAPKSSQ